jgi:hypothetical protein
MTTPTTHWIRDSGSVIETTTDVLIDELGNFFVDESGSNLLDSVSTDGEVLASAWAAIAEPNTAWANVLGNNFPDAVATRMTAQGDTRTTAQGDIRVTSESQPNIEAPTAWTEDEY